MLVINSVSSVCICYLSSCVCLFVFLRCVRICMRFADFLAACYGKILV